MTMRRTLILAVVLLLGGCSGALLPKPPPPPDFYRLSPAENAPAKGSPIAAQLLVGDISAPGAIDTARIALTPTPTRIEYFADAEWTDRAPVLVRNLLLETLQRSGRFPRVAQRSLTLHANYVVVGTLHHFEADYRAGTPPQVRVAIELQLLRMPDGDIVGERHFAAVVPARQNALPAITEALDAAAHQALAGAPSWIADMVRRPAVRRP